MRALGGDVAWHLKPQNFDFTDFTLAHWVEKSLGFWAASQLSMKAMAGYDKKIKGMAILPVDVACLGSFVHSCWILFQLVGLVSRQSFEITSV